TDMAGHQTSTVFNDSAGTTVVTFADNTTSTSTYNKAGELISFVRTGTGSTPPTLTTAYKYDGDGRLVSVIDPSGAQSYAYYDGAGHKIRDVQPDGAVIDYTYNLNDQLIKTVAYATKLTSTQLSSLASGAAGSVAALSFITPASNSADRYAWRIYD